MRENNIPNSLQAPSLREGGKTMLLSTTYFGPVQWYQKLYRSKYVLIEQHESFLKQTYRNRCVIAATNGAQTLSVPIIHSSPDSPSPSVITSIRISNHGNWRHQHWNALASAYGESPFFDYYVDDLRPFFEEEWEYLFEFNMTIMLKMCELLDIHPNIQLTKQYETAEAIRQQEDIQDYRETIRPKNPVPDESFLPRRYYQVYEQKHGFLSNMSILDLLFNLGNEAILYL